ncbi:MAG: hypothetical protein JWO67_2440 [Streptosporangiaceae bacterium]|jgi:hypothetical protein|nr:hypothetical protein [Streptosporangiaceae bacterium]
MSSTEEANSPKNEECSTLGLPEASDPRAAARYDAESVTIRFGRIDDGDCTFHWSILWLYSDGQAALQGYVATDSSGDVWIVRGMALLDRNGVELYRIPQFNGPQMDMPDHNYAFNAYPLYYPSYLYPHIVNARMYHHC